MRATFPNLLREKGYLLHTAILKSKEEVQIQALIDQGYDVNEHDHEGMAPIHYAVNHNVSAAMVLIKNGASLDERPKKSKNTPLFLAIQRDLTPLALELIEHGANVNARNQNGATALHLAANKGNETLIRALIQAGAEIEATAKSFGLLPFPYSNPIPLESALASASRNTESIESLIQEHYRRAEELDKIEMPEEDLNKELEKIKIPDNLLEDDLIKRAQKRLNEPKMIALCTLFSRQSKEQVQINPKLIEPRVIGLIKDLLPPLKS